jgi:hypothetical protein
VFPEKRQAIDYAQARALFRAGRNSCFGFDRKNRTHHCVQRGGSKALTYALFRYHSHTQGRIIRGGSRTYAKTVAEAMNLKLDMDNAADREKLRRAVLDLVAERKMPKQKGRG